MCLCSARILFAPFAQLLKDAFWVPLEPELLDIVLDDLVNHLKLAHTAFRLIHVVFVLHLFAKVEIPRPWALMQEQSSCNSVQLVQSETESKVSYTLFQKVFVLDLVQLTRDLNQLDQLAKRTAHGRTDQQYKFFSPMIRRSTSMSQPFVVYHKSMLNPMSTTAPPKLLLQKNSATLKFTGSHTQRHKNCRYLT